MKGSILTLLLITAFLVSCGGKNLQEENARLQADLDASRKKQAELENQVKEKDELLKKQQEKYDEELANVRVKFANEEKNGDVSIKKVEGGFSVTIADRLFFATGKAELTPAGKTVLNKIAVMIKEMPDKVVRVDGHTDNKPIRKGSDLYYKYQTNWELGAARAINVVRYLTEVAGIDPEIISASSYSFYHPIESNDTKKGRAQNRRIEIILIDKELNDTVLPREE